MFIFKINFFGALSVKILVYCFRRFCQGLFFMFFFNFFYDHRFYEFLFFLKGRLSFAWFLVLILSVVELTSGSMFMHVFLNISVIELTSGSMLMLVFLNITVVDN